MADLVVLLMVAGVGFFLAAYLSAYRKPPWK